MKFEKSYGFPSSDLGFSIMLGPKQTDRCCSASIAYESRVKST